MRQIIEFTVWRTSKRGLLYVEQVSVLVLRRAPLILHIFHHFLDDKSKLSLTMPFWNEKRDSTNKSRYPSAYKKLTVKERVFTNENYSVPIAALNCNHGLDFQETDISLPTGCKI